MANHLTRTEREDHAWRMAQLKLELSRIRGQRPLAEILDLINATSVREDEELLSRDWLDGLFRSRKSVEVWELRALARGLTPQLVDRWEEARRRVELYKGLLEIAYPLRWEGGDAG